MLTDDEIFDIVENVNFRMSGYRLICTRDKKNKKGRLYLQVECVRPDTYTKKMGMGRGGKFYLSEYMTESELVQKAFNAYDAYNHHETREAFEYKGKRVFGPHIDINALLEVADRIVGRE